MCDVILGFGEEGRSFKIPDQSGVLKQLSASSGISSQLVREIPRPVHRQ
jgi:hypothetical protein